MEPRKESEEEVPRLPMPSRNPLPLSSSQEAQVRELYHARVRGYCAAEIKLFAECALGRTFTAPFKCRPQNNAMNKCMVAHATQYEQDAAREEWFATRLKRQKEREAKEARRKEQEKFHREWWGLPVEDREGEKGKDVLMRAERVGGFPKRDEGQLSLLPPTKTAQGVMALPSPTILIASISNTIVETPSSSSQGLSDISPAMPSTPHPLPILEKPLRCPETVGTLIEVNQSEGKGFGVFALQDILPSTVILSETPLVTLVDTGTRADPLESAVEALSPERKEAYRALHSFRRIPSETLYRSIMYSNGFAISETATGIFEIASRINHSCIPNSEFTFDKEQGRMVFTNRFKLLRREEVTVDYGHNKRHLAKYYGFECNCGGCTDSESVTSSSSAETSQEMLSIGEILTTNGEQPTRN